MNIEEKIMQKWGIGNAWVGRVAAYLFIYRKRRREGEREGEGYQCARDVQEKLSVPSYTPPTGDLAHNPGMCPNQESSQQPFGSQANTQSTEPPQPRHFILFF